MWIFEIWLLVGFLTYLATLIDAWYIEDKVFSEPLHEELAAAVIIIILGVISLVGLIMHVYSYWLVGGADE